MKSLLSKGGILCLLCFFILSTASYSQQVTLLVDRDINSPEFGKISIKGFTSSEIAILDERELTDKNWNSFFSVSVEGSTRPMIGDYRLEENRISFKPRFLPDPQISYMVRFSSKSIGEFLKDYSVIGEKEWKISFAALKEGKNNVVRISPESASVPSNILRFYIHFSNPVNFSNPFDFIYLENSKDEIVKEPFVVIEEGLWSSDRRRLTVLVHPGRIKRNVGPNATLGEVFQPRESYNLIISDKWNLEKSFVKELTMGEPIRAKIDVNEWELIAPKTGTNNKLMIKPDRLLDEALSERLISVEATSGQQLDGRFDYDSNKSRILFTPEKSWVAGTYRLVIDPRLEDVCGNTPVSAFDVEGVGDKVKAENFNIPFTIR